MLVLEIDRVGRKLGPKGAAAKREWLLALEIEIDYGHSWRELSIVQIAGKVQRSPAAFYQYWYTVEQAVVELADAILEDDDPLSERLTAVLNLIALEKT